MNDKLPNSNLPVSIFGQVPRDQREQELEFFLSKQYNSVGLRIQNKLIMIDQQFGVAQQSSQPSITANNGNQFSSNSFVSETSAPNNAPTQQGSTITSK
jgi:hypothetical protein